MGALARLAMILSRPWCHLLGRSGTLQRSSVTGPRRAPSKRCGLPRNHGQDHRYRENHANRDRDVDGCADLGEG